MDTTKKKVPQSGATSKKAYRPPVLSQYGDVKRLTGGMMGGSGDGAGTTGNSRICWIAETLYGMEAPRVTLVRGWLARCYDRREWWALFIVPLYSRFGQRVAAAIQAFPALKQIFRPIFDRTIRRAYQEYAVRAVAQRDPA
jgi:hypothetical protein